MKTYENIKNSSQVLEGNVLVDFDYKGNVWHRFIVHEVNERGMWLHCPSGALIFEKNTDLVDGGEYFKRVY